MPWAQGRSQNKKCRGPTFLVLGGFQALSLGHRAGAKIRNVGGYVSCFGWFPSSQPRAEDRSQNRKRRGLRFLFWVVSTLYVARAKIRNVRGYVSYFGWIPSSKPRAHLVSKL